MRTGVGARLFAMADAQGKLMARRYQALARQLIQEHGSIRAAAGVLRVPHTTFAEHANGSKNAKQDSAENAVRRLRLDWRFFTDRSLGDNPNYKDFVGRQIVDYDEMVPESLLIWERSNPNLYQPDRDRQRLLDQSAFRFEREDWHKWGLLWNLMLDESPPKPPDAADMAAAKKEADELGALIPPKKVSKKR
jgi:hypothetical protein